VFVCGIVSVCMVVRLFACKGKEARAVRGDQIQPLSYSALLSSFSPSHLGCVLCLRACACCVPLLSGTGVLYLDTERKFSAARLVEIAKARSPEWYGSSSSSHSNGRNNHNGNDNYNRNGHSSTTSRNGRNGTYNEASSNHGDNNDDNDDDNTSSGDAASSFFFCDAAVSDARIEDLLRRVKVIPVDESHELMVRRKSNL